jgi:hypothetical protein
MFLPFCESSHPVLRKKVERKAGLRSGKDIKTKVIIEVKVGHGISFSGMVVWKICAVRMQSRTNGDLRIC